MIRLDKVLTSLDWGGQYAINPCGMSVPKGRYQDQVGQAGCKACAMTKYLDLAESDEAKDCKDCPAGKYLDTTGNDAASDCKNVLQERLLRWRSRCSKRLYEMHI